MARIEFHLYLITDRHQTGGRPLASVVAEAGSAGLQAVQLREKDLPTRPFLSLAREIRRITRASGTKLLINGRLDIALEVDADGVHVPADGLPLKACRRIVGEKLLGVSCHSVQEVCSAERDGADYAVLGPIYRTPSKAGYGAPLGLSVLEKACREARIPVFAIGGIRRDKFKPVFDAGAFGVAMISAILGAKDVGDTVKGMRGEIDGYKNLG
jgi:thiamine-phosphate pyrophosphorylase